MGRVLEMKRNQFRNSRASRRWPEDGCAASQPASQPASQRQQTASQLQLGEGAKNAKNAKNAKKTKKTLGFLSFLILQCKKTKKTLGF